MAANDAAFLYFVKNPLFAKTIPAKLQTYISCEITIIASAEGEAEQIIREANAGDCSLIGDTVGLVSITIELVSKFQGIYENMVNAKLHNNNNFGENKLVNSMNRYFEKSLILEE